MKSERYNRGLVSFSADLWRKLLLGKSVVDGGFFGKVKKKMVLQMGRIQIGVCITRFHMPKDHF